MKYQLLFVMSMKYTLVLVFINFVLSKHFHSTYQNCVDVECFHNYELFAQPREIIEKYIGFSEFYNVTTEDGYILSIFRIPRKNPKGVIILQHPVTTDSIVWVGQRNESLAFLLWRLEYDIWLPNHRGTYFSQKHVNLTTKDAAYWNFSFHEIGWFDYTSIIRFVRVRSAKKIIFISHSMSTTSSLIYSSLKPKEADSAVKLFIQMSPVCYLKHVRSPAKYFAHITPFLKMFNELLEITHLPEYNSKLLIFLRLFLLKFPSKKVLSAMISFFQGWNPREFDLSLMNLSISQHPKTYPWKIFYHYVQQYMSGGRFQMYDYGSQVNQEVYGTKIPPEYPVEKIITPTYLIYSKHDSLATSKDAEFLYAKLDPRAKIYGKLEISGINHVDFHYGKHRKEKVFENIVKILKKI